MVGMDEDQIDELEAEERAARGMGALFGAFEVNDENQRSVPDHGRREPVSHEIGRRLTPPLRGRRTAPSIVKF
jgi:hypothetical protein